MDSDQLKEELMELNLMSIYYEYVSVSLDDNQLEYLLIN